MGAVWLGSLPDVLRAAGLQVDTFPGWEHRSRSTGGYDDVRAVQVHHTASNTSPTNDMNYMWNNAGDRPIGAIYLARDGRVTVGAAGATNTSGKGGPLGTSGGTIPLDSANRYVISIEAANAGNGEPWPPAQTDAYVKMCAALNAAYGLLVGDTHAHFEWTSRKVDPAGASPYASGSNKWDMDAFRRDVAFATLPPTPTPPEGSPDMLILDLNPGTDWWVATLLGPVTLMHIVNGHHVAVMERGGVPRVRVDETDMDGILRSVKTTNDSPFAAGMPSHNASLDALWNAAK